MRKILSLSYFIVALMLAACGQPPPADPASESQLHPLIARISSPAIEVNVKNIPSVDRSKAVVPAEEILFDTFKQRDRIVPLSEANEPLILRLRDAIPPIYNPIFETTDEADWMNDGDLVLGYSQNDVAVAYPIKILNWHEIVSHEIDGVPILATY